MIAVIFAGPSLPPSARSTAIPELYWRPPLMQGDLYKAALARPAVIGVVDGYFDAVPTVWHKEILWAMSQGTHVYGSASIGALRAVELAPFGMKGVGRIFEAYRDGILQDDDEVAILHGPEETDYCPLTEAMVNVRATVERAVREHILDPATASVLTDIAKSLFYKDRSYEAISRAAANKGFPEATLCGLATWLPEGRVDQKRLDTLAMLEAIRAHLTTGFSSIRLACRFAHTAAWEVARRRVEAGGD
jgi:hypothetical protein